MSVAQDMQALDLWHAGLPLLQTGPETDTTLDIWYGGQPLNLYGLEQPEPARPVVFVCT